MHAYVCVRSGKKLDNLNKRGSVFISYKRTLLWLPDAADALQGQFKAVVGVGVGGGGWGFWGCHCSGCDIFKCATIFGSGMGMGVKKNLCFLFALVH